MGAEEDLAVFAQERGMGTIGINIFAGDEPQEAGDNDPTVTFCEVGAERPTKVYGRRVIAIQRPRVRVWCRSLEYGQAKAFAVQLYDLMQQQNIVINGRFYEMLEPLSEPGPLGHDQRNRQQVGFSVRTARNA